MRRIVAHPFLGALGAPCSSVQGVRILPENHPARRCWIVLNRASQILIGIGKVGDMFGGRGLTRSVGHGSRLE